MTQVKIGITSVIGWLTAALAAIPILIQLLEEGNAAVAINGPTKWAAIISVISLAVTQIGRYAQAHAQVKVGADLDVLPSELRGLPITEDPPPDVGDAHAAP